MFKVSIFLFFVAWLDILSYGNTFSDYEKIEQFDWISYLQINPEASKSINNPTKESVFRYYSDYGKQIDHEYIGKVPIGSSYQNALEKLTNYLEYSNEIKDTIRDEKIPKRFVIFHIGKQSPKNSKDVILNNILIFLSSLKTDSGRHSNTFYWLNIIGGTSNPFFDTIYNRINSFDNVALAHWTDSRSDIYMHFRTLALLNNILKQHFPMIFMMNEGVRGPFTQRENGLWLGEFEKLLYQNNVGIVGSSLCCAIFPHVQTHAFAIRNSIIPIIIENYMSELIYIPLNDWFSMIEYYEIGLSVNIVNAGFNLSSLFYANSGLGDFFKGECIDPELQNPEVPTAYYNPSTWCSIHYNQTIFFKWGGGLMRQYGLICPPIKTLMKQTLKRFFDERSIDPELIYPETLLPGPLDIFGQFNREVALSESKSKQSDSSDEFVCFFLKTNRLNLFPPDIQYILDDNLFQDINNSIESLIRQKNANWRAYYYVINNEPLDEIEVKDYNISNTTISINQFLEEKLLSYLSFYGDQRIQLIPEFVSFRDLNDLDDNRQQLNSIKEDKNFRLFLQTSNFTHCTYFSFGTADTIYGSDVVYNILRSIKDPKSDVLIFPYSSKNHFYSKSSYSPNCQAFENSNIEKDYESSISQSEKDLLKYLPSQFFHRNLFFHPQKSELLDQILVVLRKRNSFHQMVQLEYRKNLNIYIEPIKNLSSIVFDSSSPLWCIASGRTWLETRDISSCKCYDYLTIKRLEYLDKDLSESLRISSFYHWEKHYYNRKCLFFKTLN